MNKIRVCLVGLGYWGPNLLRNLLSSKTAQLAAICDTRPDALRKAGALCRGAELYDDLASVLASPTIEAVILATPSALHHEQAKASLLAGKHVLAEKPLAESVAQAMELTTLAERKRLTLMVGHTFLYNNLVDEVKGHIDSGDLGDVFYCYSQRLNLGRFRRDSDVMWTLAPHDVSIVNYWFAARPVRVSARGQSYVHRSSGVAEVCFAHLEYGDGRSAHFHLSWLDPQKRRDMVVVGSKKMLVYDDMNADAHIKIYDKSAEAEHHRPMADFADFTTRIRAGDLVIPSIRLIEPLSVEINHFAECVLSGRPPKTDGRHATDVVAVCEALGRSMAADGVTVSVLYP